MLKVKDLEGKFKNEVRYSYNENSKGNEMYTDTWKDFADFEVEKIINKGEYILLVLEY